MQRQSHVQPSLAAQGRQHGVRLLDGEDLLDDLEGDRLDIGSVGHLRVGHDRGRVRVDQHDLVALLAQGLARLGPRVVEFARLADHDRTGTDDQDLVDVRTLGQSGCAFSVWGNGRTDERERRRIGCGRRRGRARLGD